MYGRCPIKKSISDEVKDLLEDYFLGTHKDLEKELGKRLTPVYGVIDYDNVYFSEGRRSTAEEIYPLIHFEEDPRFIIILNYDRSGDKELDFAIHKPVLAFQSDSTNALQMYNYGFSMCKKYKTVKSYANAQKRVKAKPNKTIVPMVKNLNRLWTNRDKEPPSVPVAIGDVVQYSNEFYVVKSWHADPDKPNSTKECQVIVVNAMYSSSNVLQFKAKQLWGGIALASSIKQFLRDHPEDLPLYVSSDDPIARVLANHLLAEGVEE